MNCSQHTARQSELLKQLLEFVGTCKGLRGRSLDDGHLEIHQNIDSKVVVVAALHLDDILARTDADGLPFIQINFQSGLKVLLTDTLIGFKPAPQDGLDMSRLPKVVTTPDIASVFEAIQDAMHAIDAREDEVKTLRQVFEAVICGGEAIGIDLKEERSWLRRIPTQLFKITA